jgi:hypothetical protein
VDVGRCLSPRGRADRRTTPALLTALAALAAATVALPAGAGAAGGPSQGHVDPAIAQYVEMIPTAGGSAAAGTGKHEAAIPPAAKEQIAKDGGANAGLLTKVVGSQSYGAPAQFQAEPPPQTEPSPPSKPARKATKPAQSTTTSKQTPPRETAPLWVEPAPAPVPPAPGAFSTVFGSLGAGGVLFALALVGVTGFAVLPRLTRT